MSRYFHFFCTVDGAIGTAVALGLLTLPATAMQLFGVPLDPAGVLFVRTTGVLLLACSLLMVAFRNAPPSSELSAFLFCFGLGDGLLGILFLLAAISGVMNVMGYGLAVLCLGPAAAFLFFSRTASTALSVPARASTP